MSKLKEYLEATENKGQESEHIQRGGGKHSNDEILDILQKHVDGYGGPGPNYNDYIEFLDYFLSYVCDDIIDFIQHLKEEGGNQALVDRFNKILKTRLQDFSINY